MIREKAIGIVCLVIAYSLAILGAVGSYGIIPWPSLFLKFILANLVATIVIFCFSRITGNSSFYDPYWSLQPLVIIIGLLLLDPEILESSRVYLVGLLVAIYGLRLTYNFLRGWPGLHVQDWRYNDLRTIHGKMYWWVSFGGIHLFPTLLVFGGCMSLFVVVMNTSRALNWIDLAAFILTVAAIVVEARADNELHEFKTSNPPKGSLLNTGLWSWVRHPNYLGEICFWWGLYLFALAANLSSWWVLIGPLAILLLFVFISIPMKEKRMMEGKQGYSFYAKNVPLIIPFMKH